MNPDLLASTALLAQRPPFDVLPGNALEQFAAALTEVQVIGGETVYAIGDQVPGLYIVLSGTVEVLSSEDQLLWRLSSGENFGARPLLRDGIASERTRAVETVKALLLPKEHFFKLLNDYPSTRAFFDRTFHPNGGGTPRDKNEHDATLLSVSVEEVMTTRPIAVGLDTSVREAAVTMANNNISCVLVEDSSGSLQGILTTGDLTGKVVAQGLAVETPVRQVMTPNPISLPTTSLLLDAMVSFSEHNIGHLPVTSHGKAVGILTRTNLLRRQSVSAAYLIGDIAKLSDFSALAEVIAQVPQLLVQLVGTGMAAHRVAHVITSITDALTRRLLLLAKAKFGPPPVPYLWLACGSQGRQEQTGISDQDNCLMLHDDYDEGQHGDYFKALADFVCEGLDKAGFFYCPGDMMASNERWRQPIHVWRGYFRGWIARPDPMAQMLASVMFDLRPIAGDSSLYAGIQRETLDLARKNSIFRVHMIQNSLKHTPPLGVFGGFALIRSGEHKATLDLKHNGLVPIIDLARVYALEAGIEAVNTRERLIAAQQAGVLSKTGGDDLIDAFDLIGSLRLEHQARLIRSGQKPSNYMAPATLSALERNHLKDAFGVVKSLQSAIGHGRGG